MLQEEQLKQLLGLLQIDLLSTSKEVQIVEILEQETLIVDQEA